MGPFALAWIVAEGLVSYQSVKRDKIVPGPGRLAVISGLYIGLAIVAEYRPARGVVTAFAWAVNLAVLIQTVGKTPAAASGAKGWAGIPCAGNTVIFPSGTAASAALASASSTTTTSTSSGTTTATAPTSGTVLQMITALAQQFGWNNSTQLTAWQNVLNRESGGSATAKNPSSGAFGAAQALGHGGNGTACPSTGENNYGGFGLTTAQAQAANCGNLADQLLWMAGYIKATYGTPAAAWESEQTRGYY